MSVGPHKVEIVYIRPKVGSRKVRTFLLDGKPIAVRSYSIHDGVEALGTVSIEILATATICEEDEE